MKYVACLMITLTIVSNIALGQNANIPSSLQTLVDAERAFARSSEQDGTQQAFLAFIANTGILFRPTAVNGRRWMLEHPVPQSTKRPLLSWYPIFADISEAGDLGYTTGPWEFKQDIKDAQPSGHGTFVTVWKKQDETWKFVIDLGISHGPPTNQNPKLETGKESKSRKPSKSDLNALRAELIKRDWEFSSEAQSKGIRNAFLSYSTNEVRLLRNDKFPFVGREAVKKAFGKEKESWTSQPDFADVAGSGDLGYTYGTYEIKRVGVAKGEKGNYLRIWKQRDNKWKIELEVTNPLPGDTKQN